MLWNYDAGNWLFFLSPFTYYLLFVCWSCKGIKDGKEKKTGISLNLVFIFRFYDYFVVRECFPEQVEITVHPIKAFEESQELFVANSESLVSSIFSHIVNLRVRHVCLCSVDMFSWRSYERETQGAVRPEALADTCAPTDCREKKETYAQSKYIKGLEKNFLFGANKPLFFRHERIALSVRGLLGDCYFCIYLFYLAFILFFPVIVFFLNFLFNLHKFGGFLF